MIKNSFPHTFLIKIYFTRMGDTFKRKCLLLTVGIITELVNMKAMETFG